MIMPVLMLGMLFATDALERPSVVVVVGAAGASEFETPFAQWAARWRDATRSAGGSYTAIGQAESAAASDRDLLKRTLDAEVARPVAPLWLVLIGHGTFDGREAKFNLRGADVSDTELAEWLKPITRPTIVFGCFSASGPFLNKLSRRDRVIVTATRSGSELNAARFGRYAAEAMADLSADLDKDGQVSALELFLAASGRVEQSYKDQSRLATEHALLDDNGDALGTPASFFQGVRAVRRARDGAPLDGARARQFALVKSRRERALPFALRQRRDMLERQLEDLRDAKDKIDQTQYYKQVEAIALELARLYDQAHALDAKDR